MHPLLERLSIFTWMDILESNEKSILFLEDLQLIPKRTDPAPACPRCSGPMDVEEAWLKKSILGWKWRCKKRYAGYSTQTSRFEDGYFVEPEYCFAGVNPLDGTFFEDIRLPLNDVLALMFGYILQINFTSIKEHLNCWRIYRNESQISDPTVQNIYFRLDQIILFALSQQGKSLKKHEKVNRKILLKEYAKTLKVEPIFRNIVCQLLMTIKYRYPCIKNEIRCESVDLAISTDTIYSTNENFLVNNTVSNEIVLDPAISTASPVLNSCAVGTDNTFVRSVNANSVSITESAQTTNLKALNSSAASTENTIVRNVNANSVPITASAQNGNLETLISSAVSVDNTIVRSVNGNSVPITASAQTTNLEALNYSAVNVDNTIVRSVNGNSVPVTTFALTANSVALSSSIISVDNTIVRSINGNSVPVTTFAVTANSVALNSSTVSVDNTIVRSVNGNSVPITASALTANSVALNSTVNVDNTIVRSVTANSVPISAGVQITNSSNYQSISPDKVLIKNENNVIKTEDVTNSNSSFSADISFSNSIVSLKDNFISNSLSDCDIIIDGIVHDDMDIGSVIDVSDSAQTTNIATCNSLNFVADVVICNQNENDIENANNMNTSSSLDVSFEDSTASVTDNSICNSPDHISIDGSLSDNSMCDSPDHVNDGSLSDNFICNSPSDRVIVDGSLTDNSFCTSSDCVIIDGIVFQDDLTMNIDHVEIVNTTNNE